MSSPTPFPFFPRFHCSDHFAGITNMLQRISEKIDRLDQSRHSVSPGIPPLSPSGEPRASSATSCRSAGFPLSSKDKANQEQHHAQLSNEALTGINKLDLSTTAQPAVGTFQHRQNYTQYDRATPTIACSSSVISNISQEACNGHRRQKRPYICHVECFPVSITMDKLLHLGSKYGVVVAAELCRSTSGVLQG